MGRGCIVENTKCFDFFQVLQQLNTWLPDVTDTSPSRVEGLDATAPLPPAAVFASSTINGHMLRLMLRGATVVHKAIHPATSKYIGGGGSCLRINTTESFAVKVSSSIDNIYWNTPILDSMYPTSNRLI
jgi:hypothetical protein